jgi:hypothetical protein
LREGKLRGELNLSEAKSSAMPTELVTAMKQAGMDKVITIVRADKKATFVSYPGAQAYTEVPFRTNELALEKIEFTEVAKETIDGHPCVKKKTSIADSRGRPQEFFVWHASDLKDFPLQMELPQRANKVIVKLQSPKMETPDVSVFDVPASYTKYTNAQDLMQAAMMKMFSTPPAAK